MSGALDVCFEVEDHLVGVRFDKAVAGLAAPAFSRERLMAWW